MPEHGDVVIGNVPIRDGAHFPVAEVIAGEQVVVVEIILGAIRSDCLAVSPVLRQIKPQVQFDQLALRGFEFVEAHVPAVDERGGRACSDSLSG
jgi:hypothetical protein